MKPAIPSTCPIRCILLISVCFISIFCKAQPVDQIFRSSGTYTVPRGYTASVHIMCVGGGGGGGTGSDVTLARGGGGSGGLVRSQNVSLPAGTYNLVVGNGGSAGANGGNSTFTTPIGTVTGFGGSAPTANTQSGGAGGNASGLTGSGITNLIRIGRTGGNAACANPTFCGGGGGGAANNQTTNGTNGQNGSGSTGGLGGTNPDAFPITWGQGGKGGDDFEAGGNGTNSPNSITISMASNLFHGAGGGGKGSRAGVNSGSGSSGVVWIDVQSFLPIELGEFLVYNQENEVTIKWTTYSETNFDQYVIERSYDSKNFKPIGSIKGKGSQSKQKMSYEFIDVPNLYREKAYYRLKILDLDQSFNYSPIKVAHLKPAKTVAIYPTLVQSEVNIIVPYLNDPEYDRVKIRITDLNGRLIEQYILPSAHTKIDVKKISLGTYFIQLIQADQSKTFRFVKME